MNLDEAKEILNGSERHELRDHAFGDMEVTWMKDGEEVGFGYFGKSESVIVTNSPFFGEAARELLRCGTLVGVERNDSTGPDGFVVGQTMPELTTEGVKQELIRHNIFEERNRENSS